MVGHIKVDRKILEWEWYKHPIVFRVFLHLLLTANHKDGKWQGVSINRGQLITGRIELGSQLKLSEQQIRTALSKIKLTKEITIKSTSHYSIITICKYDSYQSFKEKDNQPNNQQLTSETTSEQPTTNQQLTTNNNVNNDNNDKKIIIYKPTAENFTGLPQIKIGAVIQLLKITKQIDILPEQVSGLWEVFKVQNLNGKKHYNNEDDVYSHFINWSNKIDTDGKSKNKTGSTATVAERQQSGLDILLRQGKEIYDTKRGKDAGA